MGLFEAFDDPDLFSTLLERLDVEWLTIVALREGVSLALRDVGSATYRDTLRLGELLAPVLFHRDRSLLARQWESTEAQECRGIADAENISFEDAVRKQIRTYESWISTSATEHHKALRNKLLKYKKVLQETRTREFYEGEVIWRDFDGGLKLPFSRPEVGYREFVLPSNRVMRIRIVHETKVEDINGADLIYEHHWLEKEMLKVAAVQFKIMRKERYVPKSKDLRDQIRRMTTNFCNGQPCMQPNPSGDRRIFRLPFCSAFLRATNKLQSTDAATISTGYYLPICRVRQVWENGEEISQNTLQGEAISFRVFEELFNTNILGSSWLTYHDIERIYQQHKVLEPEDTVAVHIQVVG
jgi:hypothetical protein